MAIGVDHALLVKDVVCCDELSFKLLGLLVLMVDDVEHWSIVRTASRSCLSQSPEALAGPSAYQSMSTIDGIFDP